MNNESSLVDTIQKMIRPAASVAMACGVLASGCAGNQYPRDVSEPFQNNSSVYEINEMKVSEKAGKQLASARGEMDEFEQDPKNYLLENKHVLKMIDRDADNKIGVPETSNYIMTKYSVQD